MNLRMVKLLNPWGGHHVATATPVLNPRDWSWSSGLWNREQGTLMMRLLGIKVRLRVCAGVAERRAFRW